MILCIGSAADSTFLHLLTRLRRRKVVVHAVDIVQLFASGAMFLNQHSSLSGLRIGETRFTFSDYGGFWVRLPGGFSAAAPSGVDADGFGLVESAIARFFTSHPSKVVNPPRSDQSNSSKLAHLLYYTDTISISRPQTLVSNHPERAAEFVQRHSGKVVVKGASSRKTWARRWDSVQDFARLSMISDVPVLLQEEIHGFDVRVHTAADTIHGEGIVSDDLDYRTSRNNRFFQIDVPPEVAIACRQMVALSGCPLLGIDFKVRPTGEWVFLEANPMPCFEGYDKRSGWAISDALISFLGSPLP